MYEVVDSRGARGFKWLSYHDWPEHTRGSQYDRIMSVDVARRFIHPDAKLMHALSFITPTPDDPNACFRPLPLRALLIQGAQSIREHWLPAVRHANEDIRDRLGALRGFWPDDITDCMFFFLYFLIQFEHGVDDIVQSWAQSELDYWDMFVESLDELSRFYINEWPIVRHEMDIDQSMQHLDNRQEVIQSNLDFVESHLPRIRVENRYDALLGGIKDRIHTLRRTRQRLDPQFIAKG
jgi:hypothetical protein